MDFPELKPLPAECREHKEIPRYGDGIISADFPPIKVERKENNEL
jgi:hypothetical protein